MGIVLHQFTVITSKTTRFEHFAPPPLFALSQSTSVSTNFFEPIFYLLFVSIFRSTSLLVSSRNDQGYTWVSPFCGYPCSRYISDDTPHSIPSRNDSKPMDDPPYQLICYSTQLRYHPYTSISDLWSTVSYHLCCLHKSKRSPLKILWTLITI